MDGEVTRGGGCCGWPVLEELLSSGARRQGVSLLSSLWVAVQGRGREEEGEGIGRMRQGRLAALEEKRRERWARSLAARVKGRGLGLRAAATGSPSAAPR